MEGKLAAAMSLACLGTTHSEGLSGPIFCFPEHWFQHDLFNLPETCSDTMYFQHTHKNNCKQRYSISNLYHVSLLRGYGMIISSLLFSTFQWKTFITFQNLTYVLEWYARNSAPLVWEIIEYEEISLLMHLTDCPPTPPPFISCHSDLQLILKLSTDDLCATWLLSCTLCLMLENPGHSSLQPAALYLLVFTGYLA